MSLSLLAHLAEVEARKSDAVNMFSSLLQGQQVEISCYDFKMIVSIDIDDNIRGTIHVHNDTKLLEDDASRNNNSNNTTHAKSSFASKIFDGFFCSKLLDSILTTGFLDDNEVERLVESKAGFLNNNNNENDEKQDGSTASFTTGQIKAASKMIIDNSHLFFLAVVSIDRNLFRFPIRDVFAKLDVFSDSRVAVIAHLLQGRKALFKNQVKQNLSFNSEALQTFCATLAGETEEPKPFVSSALRLLDLNQKFDGTIPKQLAVALIAKQFSTLSLDTLGRNEKNFSVSVNWLNRNCICAGQIASSANQSETIHAVIGTHRHMGSLQQAIIDCWKLRGRSSNDTFLQEFSSINSRFAMALSDKACGVIDSRHLRMHGVDTTSLEVPPSAKKEIQIDERKIYIVPGSSGLGKTTGCICYNPHAPRIYMDSGADMDDEHRRNIATLTSALHSAQATAGEAGQPLTAAQLRGVRDGYASLLLLHAILRTFESYKNWFAHSCVALPSFFPYRYSDANVEEIILRAFKNIPPEVLQDKDDAAATCRAMLKTYSRQDLIQKSLGLNAEFAETLILILDETGGCPDVMRGLSSCWDGCLLPWLKESLKMNDTSKVIFFAAGTGSQRIATTICDSRTLETECLCFCTVQPNRVFLNSLVHFKEGHPMEEKTVVSFCLFDLIFEEITSAPRPKQNPPGDDDSPNSSGISSGSKTYKLRRNITTAQLRYVQMVIQNARCAAIATKLIGESCGPRKMQIPAFADCFLWSFLPGWSMAVASFFPRLNGLSIWGQQGKVLCAAEALRISMTKQLTIDVENDLCVRFGLLEDTARLIDDADVDQFYHHVINSSNGKSLVCGMQMTRYRVTETCVAFLLTQFGRCSVGIADCTACDVLDQSAADYQLMCLVLNCAQYVARSEPDVEERDKWIARLPPICRLYVEHNVVITGSVFYRKLSNWLARESGQIPNGDFRLWRKVVFGNNGAVVLVNGSCAPFADIVVITKKVIFLTQTKYLSSGSSFDATTEFDKMHSDSDNARTRELLMWCCGDTRDVTFVCIILTKTARGGHPCKKEGKNEDEGFKYEEHFVAAFEEKMVKPRKKEVDAASAQNNNNNNDDDDDSNTTKKAAVKNLKPKATKTATTSAEPAPKKTSLRPPQGPPDEIKPTTKAGDNAAMAINPVSTTESVGSHYAQYGRIEFYCNPKQKKVVSTNSVEDNNESAGQRRQRQ